MSKLGWAVVLSCVVAGSGHAAPDADPLVDPRQRGPEPEVFKPGITLSLPAVPAFDVPPANPDGSHAPREMRVRSKSFLDREVTIKGVITWAYDCVTAIRTKGQTDKQVKDLIDRDPTLCERPKFYVGDQGTRPEASLWIVDVPRPYNRLELMNMKKVDRTDPARCEPDDKRSKICPPYKAGDVVEVSGTWKLSSPHSERNSDGLLVYKRMKNVTQNWESSEPAPPSAPSIPDSTPAYLSAPLPAAAAPIMAKVRQSVLATSNQYANEATRAYGMRQWDTAIERYTKAVDAWPNNASAWYGMSAAHAQKRAWDKAAEIAAHAVAIDPRVAMYRLMYGRTLYERSILRAKEDQARRQNVRVEDVDVDYATVNFEKAFVELRLAVQLEPGLWRAHYLIGSIYRAVGKAKEAAAAFTKALDFGPREPAPWVALCELYRAWDYTDAAIQVAQQGTLIVPGDTEKSEIWFELGMGYEDKRANDRAIEAFTKALDSRRDNYKALFARGQAQFLKGAYPEAKVDLEEFLKVATGSIDFFKQQASRMLMDIAAKPARK